MNEKNDDGERPKREREGGGSRGRGGGGEEEVEELKLFFLLSSILNESLPSNCMTKSKVHEKALAY